jgi:tetratricopeptide (TPR) repeat protein
MKSAFPHLCFVSDTQGEIAYELGLQNAHNSATTGSLLRTVFSVRHGVLCPSGQLEFWRVLREAEPEAHSRALHQALDGVASLLAHQRMLTHRIVARVVEGATAAAALAQASGCCAEHFTTAGATEVWLDLCAFLGADFNGTSSTVCKAWGQKHSEARFLRLVKTATSLREAVLGCPLDPSEAKETTYSPPTRCDGVVPLAELHAGAVMAIQDTRGLCGAAIAEARRADGRGGRARACAAAGILHSVAAALKVDGNECFGSQQLALAEVAYTQALSLLPRVPDGGEGEGESESESESENESKSESSLRPALRQLTKLRVTLASNLAAVLLQQRRYAGALEYCNEALVLDSAHVKARYHRARIFMATNRAAEACVDFRNVVQNVDGAPGILLDARKALARLQGA